MCLHSIGIPNMKKILTYLVVNCCSMFAASQRIDNIFFHFNADNTNYPGYFLAENIAQENNGIIWLGGREGLLRFDGKHFQSFKSKRLDSASIPGNYIAAQLIEGNNLYGGTFATGFFVMDLQTLKVKQLPLLGKHIGLKFTATAIASKNKDSLWVACSKKQLICISKNTFQPHPGFKLKPLPGNALDSGTIFTVQPAKNNPGKIWLITNRSILLADGQTGTYSTYQFTVKNEKDQVVVLENPTAIVEETDSTALVSFFKRGIIKWNYKKNTWQHFLFAVNAARISHNIINKIIPKAGNEYFVASSDSGLYIFNSITGQFKKEGTQTSHQPQLFKEPVRNLFADKYGGIIFSSIGSISYWHPAYQVVKAYSAPAPLLPTVASSVQHHNNNIVITRRDAKNPLAIFSRKKNDWLPIPGNQGAEDYVRLKIPYQGNYIYLTINSNWLQYDDQSKNLKTFVGNTLLTTQKKINGIDENDSHVVYTSSDGLYVHDKKTGLIRHHKSSEAKDSLHAKITLHAKIDKHNQAWFASLYGIGLYNLKTGKFTEYSFRTNEQWQGLRVISDLQLSKNGLLYVATQEDGVYVFDTRTHSLKAHYNKDYLLFENFVNNILIDSTQQYLWVATLSGLNVIDLKQQYSKRWDKQNSGLKFGDGFFGFTLLNNQEIYGADSVLYNFSMGSFKKMDLKPFVSGYVVGKNYHYSIGDIQLQKNINYIELFISTGFLADAAHSVIQYRLSENEAWNKVENGKIIIPDLKNGETTIQLRASLQGVLYGEGENIIRIKRDFYYYQTWWFKAILVLLIAAFSYFFFRKRIEQVRRQEREKALLQHKINELEIASLRSQMNPHFIFNTLSSLRYLVLKSENKIAAAFILKLSKLLRMILFHSGETVISLQDELQALDLYLDIEALRFDNGFSYAIQIDESVETFDIKVPPMLLQPFVENAIKHGLVNSGLDEKWVNVSINRTTDTTIKIIITDNGIGRRNASLLHSNKQHISVGTEITNQRVELFNKTANASINCKVYDYCNDASHPGTVVEILYTHSLRPL